MISLGGWKAALAAGAVALALLGWAIFERKDAQLQAERRVAAERQVAVLKAAVETSELERRKDREIADAGDRAVGTVIAGRETLQTRTVTIMREIVREPDCNDPVGPVLRAAFDRLRVLDGEDRARRRDAGGAGPAPGLAAAGAGAPRGAVTNCAAGEYLVRLFGHALGLEGQLYGIGDWAEDARRIREGKP